MRDSEGKKTIAKELAGFDDAPRLDLQTGVIKNKKVKKVKTDEEKAMAELKVLEKKLLSISIRPCIFQRVLF